MGVVHIPYYDPKSNHIRRFFPDFIFWLQKGQDYAIVFVDPKGMQHTDYQHKIDGFRDLFCGETGAPKVFSCNGMTVRVHLLMYTTQDAHQAPKAYWEHWFDWPGKIPGCLESDSTS